MLRRLKRRFTLFKGSVQSFVYRKKLRLFECMAKHNFILAYHNSNLVRRYSLEPPTVYNHFDIFRIRGIISYAANRIITDTQVWYYPKWKEDKVENATLVISNSSHEEVEIIMKGQITEFLLHPPMFEPSIWISSNNHVTRIAVMEHSFDVFAPPSTEDIKREACAVKEYTVDLSKYSMNSSAKIHITEYSREKGRLLKAMYDGVLNYALNNLERINEIVSGIEETNEIGRNLSIVPDVLCPECQHVIIKSPYGEHCIKYCKPYYTSMPVSHVEWLKMCEKDRDEINIIQKLYGFDK